MPIVNELIIPPMSARAFVVRRGQTLRVIDVAGGQPGDLVAFAAEDLSVTFSQARTRVENRTVRVTAGHGLWTNAQPPAMMFTITADTGGPHDLLYTPCCRYALETRFGVTRDGCLENLVAALAPWRVAERDVPDPLNLFFNVEVDAAGALTIGTHNSSAGSFIELRAEMDCVVAVSTCAVPVAGRENSPYRVEILDA